MVAVSAYQFSTMTTRTLGARIPRNEDPRLLRGRGSFVDDIKLQDMLHAAVLRSPLRVWDSTQAPLPIKNGLARIFGPPEFRVDVIAPDVGDGFGTNIT